MTYTVATLEVSPATFDEIDCKLRAANYDHCFDEKGMIDMTHIGLTRENSGTVPASLRVSENAGGGAVAVSQDIYWRYDAAPRGVKLFLLTKGGVAVTGTWSDNGGYLAWQSMFKRDKTKEA